MNKYFVLLAFVLCIASSSLIGFRNKAPNSQIANSNNPLPQCLETQFYSKSTNKCLSCSTDQNSNGTVIAHHVCACNEGYYWNHMSQVCSTCPASGCPKAPKQNNVKISCLKNQFYNRDSEQCKACSADINSNGISTNSHTCECNQNYEWNSKSQLCVVCPLEGCELNETQNNLRTQATQNTSAIIQN